ncbi:hypothetical protein, partial [Enterobacter sp. PTB]|uniref:hypothetical protein n=1 Tax=Enterobacter sp. PTB TaxID=3143437 RepID=UPI003DA7C403
DTGKKYFIVVDGSGLRIDEDSTAGNSILSYAGASKQMKTVGQFVPTDYTNFDNRYQAKGSYCVFRSVRSCFRVERRSAI